MIKISYTNKRELDSAATHAYHAKELLSKVLDKINKRGVDRTKILKAYRTAFRLREELLLLLDDCETTIGGV